VKSNYKIYQYSAGFTLIELLVAASITTVVVSAAGFGLVNIMGANSKAEAETLRRIELNRALDFMAEEVRMASSIATDVDINVHSSLAPNFPSDCDNSSDGVDCALILHIPDVKQQGVIYYVASPPEDSPWLGPRVIYRWGPDFLANGTYSNPDDPAEWDAQPLVDRIEDNLDSPYWTTCPTGDPSVTTDDWSPKLNDPTENAEDRDSFYACINPTGKIAEIFILGEVEGAYGSSAPHQVVSTRVFARSAISTSPSPSDDEDEEND